jgi:hypothetical protein
MTANKISIFDSIVKDENSLTELLLNYLQFDFFRFKIIEKIGIPNQVKDSLSYYDFSTQYSIGKHGRPDLTIINEKIAIHFEVKTNNFRSLTNNQPLGYLKSLDKQNAKFKKLIFLIPENYYYADSIELRIAKSPKNVKIQILTWHEIIDIILINKFHLNYPLFNEYLNFIESYFKPKKIIFMTNELQSLNNSDFAKGLDKVLRLLNETFSPIQTKFKKSFKKSTTDFLSEYGFNLYKNSNVSLFIGVWFHAWKITGMPICICLCENYTQKNIRTFERLVNIHKLNLVTIVDEENISWICATIPEQILNSPDNLKHLVTIFKDFGNAWT